jgi:hypothetical protein
MGMAKAERLLFLINLIRSHRNLTSGELAERSGVSERTIFRDINSLASARFPIYYDRGYKFLEGAFLPTLNLSREELSALDFVFEFSPLKSEKSLSLLARDIHTKLEAGRRNPNSEKAARSVRVGENQDSPSEGMSSHHSEESGEDQTSEARRALRRNLDRALRSCAGKPKLAGALLLSRLRQDRFIRYQQDRERLANLRTLQIQAQLGQDFYASPLA